MSGIVVPSAFERNLELHEKIRRFDFDAKTGKYIQNVEGAFIITFFLKKCRMMYWNLYVRMRYYALLIQQKEGKAVFTNTVRDLENKMQTIVGGWSSYGPESLYPISPEGLFDFVADFLGSVPAEIKAIATPPDYEAFVKSFADA